jgi:hypothetical protein
VIGPLALAFLAILAGPASAHAEREVGPYGIEIGFLNEPVYAGFQNGVFMDVTEHASGNPITGLENSLKVAVLFGNQSMDVSVEPITDLAGQYVAAFIPTRPGAYTFHITGDIKGTKVDLELTSGPQTFDEVQNPTSVEFPAKDPTVADVATKLDRETARLQQAANAAEQRARSAADDASGAKTFGILGIAVGAVGLATAVVALATRRGSSASMTAAPDSAPTPTARG